MRHQKRGRKLGRHSAHRDAMWRNMVTSLLQHETIQTTDAKAKELKRLADRTITWSTQLGELLNKDRETFDAEEKARLVHSVRMAKRMVPDAAVLNKLFSELGPRYLGRLGGYTRVIKYRVRHGDAAPISIVELVDRPEKVKEEAPAKGKKDKAEKSAE
jgi:large subunit ribosomal protein L17